MVRFKVIRGSHLMLTLSALILAAVVAFILLQSSAAVEDSSRYSRNEAKAISAFASNPSEDASVQIEIIADKQETHPFANTQSILIYHTHTHEAYEQTETSSYEALEAWRTEDEQHSVVRIGAALEDELSKLGYFVVHDRTDHEKDNMDLAYVRSLETLEAYSLDFDLVIDIHRDAYVEGLPRCLEADGERYAQIMLLVGNGDSYQGAERPDYEKNLSFAQQLTRTLNQMQEGIARNVTIKKGRYNQHIGKNSVLIEVGHNQNTLDEALASVPILAKSIAKILK